MRIQKSGSLFTMQCVLFLVKHRDIVLFFAADFPPFRSVLLVVPPGQPHHPHISSLLLTCCHLLSLFIAFLSLSSVFASFPYFSLLILITFVIFSSSVPNPPPVTFPHYSLKYFPPPKIISYPSLALTGTKV